MAVKENKLFRSKTDRVLLGVCGGLGDYFNIDSTIIRIIFIILAFNGIGILLYIIMALIMPNEPETVSGVGGSGETQSSSTNSAAQQGEPIINKDKVREFADDFGERARDMAEELKNNSRVKGSGRNILGLVIVLVGLSLLLRQFFPFYFNWLNWNIFWPVILILIGIFFIVKNRD